MGIGNRVKQVAKDDAGAARNEADDAPVDVAPPRTIADTLMSDASSPDDRWLGFIDRVTSSCIEGWALDRANPAARSAVEVVTSNGKRVVCVAHLFRQDVADAGHGDGFCGFFIDMSKLALNNETAIVRFVEGKQLISEAPIAFDPEQSVLTTEMPSAFTGAMLLLATEVRQAADDLNAEDLNAENLDVRR